MNDIPFKATYYNKDLNDCTKMELIECIKYLNDLYEKEIEQHKITRDIMKIIMEKFYK